MRIRLNLREVGRLSMSKLIYKQNEILTFIVLLMKIVTSGYVGERNWFFQPDGEGVYTYSDGTVYSGSFENGLRRGEGVNTWASGSVYSGSWKNGKKHGEGVYTWADGHVYSGSYENDNRHGQGVMSYASGKQ